MGNPLVLTFDIGTQSARCLLVNQNGEFIDICQSKYDEPYYSRNPGWAEQRPTFYYDKLIEVASELCRKNKESLSDIIAVTLTVIRDTVMCLDENNEPLRDIILWLDKRQAEFNNPFGFVKKTIFKVAGMEDSTKIIYKASVGNWIMQNQPDIWEKTAKYVMLPAYLNFKLTGRLVDSVANMIGHVPFDYKNRRWMTKNALTRCICDVPAQKLCELINSGEIIGTITDEICELTGIPKGLPLISTGSDKGCETLGLSVFKTNQAAISFGTTATIQMTVKKYFEPQKFMPAYPAVPNDMYNPEIQIFRGFWLLSWFIKEFGASECEEAKNLHCLPEKLLDAQLERIPAGCEGLLLQPYWTPGIANPNALGSIIGFSDFHTRYHLYKAIIEGLNFELYSCLKLMEKRSGLKVDEIFIGGGGAKSEAVCQITADMFGLPVKRIQTHEACSIGSSIVAFIAKGVFNNYEDAIKSMVHERDVFLPRNDEHKLYMRLYNDVYSEIYGKMNSLFKKIRKIYKRR
ncbi:MAG: FGGY-family carbohydrate kinase [Oscillospiraceae bacterium]